ncbi:hypothetical protein QTP70_028524 [Hemibagrus guttatus]|uniref:Integrase p58-like C-terminal domain-containing protein n=1 Tax=Hemibagrus guttatus TaxID=175788 RepID=A0AAE0RBK6_9TELE|nr:hypothetical protein QTP70_028524 [Hemibagrus guttatus]KAK3570137.1 hypothetical protein QTP86_012512 [Hemibagrus guttatus]
MLLVPNIACKFLAKWQGPYTVLGRVGPVNYRLQQPDPQQRTLIRRAEELSPAQQQDLTELIDQFAPGLMQLVQEIITPPGMVVRQQPYRVPEACRRAIEEEVERMLRDGVIDTPPARGPAPL